MHQLRRQAQDPSFSLSSQEKNNKRKKQRCTRTFSVTVTSKACNICRSGNSQTTAATATAALFLPPPTNVDGQNTRDLVSKIITSITFAHYLESFKPGSFQNTMDDMFKENNLPKVNFPTKLFGQEFRNLLNQTENNVNEPQSTNTPVEVNNANNKINKVNNDMESEYHNKREREESSPVSSRKKREMERERETEIVEELVLHREATNTTNIAKFQSEREEIAPNHQPLPQRDPQLRAAAERERERVRGREGGGRRRRGEGGWRRRKMDISTLSHTAILKQLTFIFMSERKITSIPLQEAQIRMSK